MNRTFGILLVLLLSGCVSMPVPLSVQTRNQDLYTEGAMEVIPILLQQVKFGMCEDEVFRILQITHDTPNLIDLDVRTVYEHVNLLNGRTSKNHDCDIGHTAEVPYIGHRIPFTNIRNSGYLKGVYKWARRSVGEDWYLDLLFERGTFISYSLGGEKFRDVQDLAYPWDAIFRDPYGTASNR